MKKLLYLLIFAFMQMCFTACGGDDEEGTTNNVDNNESSISLSGEERMFVGYWNLSVGANFHNFVFFPNGKAVRDGSAYGKWQYSKDTKILATNIEMWQFQINAIFDDSWTGVTVNTSRGVNATKCKDDLYLKSYIKIVNFSQWEDGKLYDPFELKEGDSGGSTNFGWTKSAQEITFNDIKISDTKITATAEVSWFYRSLSRNEDYSFLRSININNPFSNNPTLEIKNLDNKNNSELKEGTYNGVWKH